MSIVTKTGDEGTTALMYGRRVAKCHPRVEACGAVDELNAALGLVRAAVEEKFLRQNLLSVQRELVALMGELAVAAEDWERYLKDAYPRITPEHVGRLEKWIDDLERTGVSFTGWAMPGATALSAHLDLARTVCRRAERRICLLKQDGELQNAGILVYLNRLADWLWLLGRQVESRR